MKWNFFLLDPMGDAGPRQLGTGNHAAAGTGAKTRGGQPVERGRIPPAIARPWKEPAAIGSSCTPMRWSALG
ncbi:MAG: hypothetical protein N838_20615 [Thiohalocapsa sp. PB-PSB1]|nr:MAG: hypothetical protein N838_20615 [Thiohalocapsa sp. PB-PSB1]